MDENVERGVSDRQALEDIASPAERDRPSSPDRILSAIGNEHRRAILVALTGASDKTLEYDALVAQVAERVLDETGGRVSEDRRQPVRIALHHTHLPKLEEVGIVDYETESGQVQFVGGELEREILRLVQSFDAGE